ncbi:uncharacterized protein N7483_002592 [Penicillium malachiteum]|uniref:uncharacterized protein n=1 Tax=Penicillium malachiteum TaxID=1324776 RepID=UPI002548A9EF|nr:uncharacterized protein N7483_002592 [Penicillium malachiteum]KAJ5737467.1 hypothetical protein N7483_002592 [Penicillium malachiteum]
MQVVVNLRRLSQYTSNYGRARAVQMEWISRDSCWLLARMPPGSPSQHPLSSHHVTYGYAPILLKRSRFELPKIYAHFIGESKNSENSVLGDINFTQKFSLMGVGIYEETVMTCRATRRTAMAEQRRGLAYWRWTSSSVACHPSTTVGVAPRWCGVRCKLGVSLRCIVLSSPCDICAVAYIPAWLHESHVCDSRLSPARLFALFPNTAGSADFDLKNAIVLIAGDAS